MVCTDKIFHKDTHTHTHTHTQNKKKEGGGDRASCLSHPHRQQKKGRMLSADEIPHKRKRRKGGIQCFVLRSSTKAKWDRSLSAHTVPLTPPHNGATVLVDALSLYPYYKGKEMFCRQIRIILRQTETAQSQSLAGGKCVTARMRHYSTLFIPPDLDCFFLFF